MRNKVSYENIKLIVRYEVIITRIKVTIVIYKVVVMRNTVAFFIYSVNF